MEKSSKICQQAQRLCVQLVSRVFLLQNTETITSVYPSAIICFALFALHLSRVEVDARVNIVANLNSANPSSHKIKWANMRNGRRHHKQCHRFVDDVVAHFSL